MAKEWGPIPERRRAPDPDKGEVYGPRHGGRSCAIMAVALLGVALVALRAAVEVFA